MRAPLAAILTLALATATAAADPVQTPGSNVTVTFCKAQIGTLPPLKIGYTNTAPKTALEVDFTVVSSAGTIRTVKDTGKFETNTPISHVFELPDDTSPLGLSSARCVVTKVVYADGTSWTNPSPP